LFFNRALFMRCEPLFGIHLCDHTTNDIDAKWILSLF